MSQIELNSITKKYDKNVETISNLDLTVNSGEFMVFVGPSGCGKTTLLRMIAGLETITSGTIKIDDERVNDLSPVKRQVAMVFQSYALYPHMTVEQNMGFALKIGGMSKDSIAKKVREVAETLQLSELLDRYPKQLSGGQRQRVAIGRCIVRSPKVFLFDEPLSNLDAALRVQMRLEIAQLHEKLKTTMIYVTHDQTEAMTLGHRIVVFNNGKIEQLGTPMELYQNPTNRFVAEFLGTPKINLIPYKWEKQTAILGGKAIDLNVKSLKKDELKKLNSGAKFIAIRPENLLVVDAKDKLFSVKINFIELLGDCAILHSNIGENDLRIKINRLVTQEYKTGQEIHLSFDIDQTIMFDEAGKVI